LLHSEIDEIIHFCSTAFDEDFAKYYETFIDPIHLLARIDGKLVSHALWITRWLQVHGQKLMRTAYVEGVATIQNQRNQGFSSSLMVCLADEIKA
jgi:predicted acetyltransferase